MIDKTNINWSDSTLVTKHTKKIIAQHNGEPDDAEPAFSVGFIARGQHRGESAFDQEHMADCDNGLSEEDPDGGPKLTVVQNDQRVQNEAVDHVFRLATAPAGDHRALGEQHKLKVPMDGLCGGVHFSTYLI